MRLPIYGKTLGGATITVNVAGGAAASIYAAASGGAPGSTVTADDTGAAVFYYDDATYPFPAFFDLSVALTGYDTVLRTNVWNFFDTVVSSAVDVSVSELTLCNRALVLVGGQVLASFQSTNDASKTVSRLYPSTRDGVLRAYPWNCAMAYDTLSVDATAPAWGYEYRFSLPNDCLRVLGLDTTSYIYKIVGRYLYTNDVDDDLNIRYTRKETDPAVWDPLLTEALVMRLSSLLAVPIAGDKALAKLQWELYDRLLREARSIDGQEGSVDSIESDDLTSFRL